MWFYECDVYKQEVTATATGRGIYDDVRENGQKAYEMWGGVGRADMAHVDKPFALTRAGETTCVSPQNPSVNRGDAAYEKQMIADARSQGEFTRINGIDPSAERGTRYGQPPPQEIFQSDSFKNWHAAEPPERPAMADPAPAAEPSQSQQWEMFGRTDDLGHAPGQGQKMSR